MQNKFLELFTAPSPEKNNKQIKKHQQFTTQPTNQNPHQKKVNSNCWEFFFKRTFKRNCLATVVPNCCALERCKL